MNNTRSTVIPAQAGIHATIDSPDVDGVFGGCVKLGTLKNPSGKEYTETHMDPGLRRDDGGVEISLEGSVG